MVVSVKFWHCVWDNYQGASGKIIEQTMPMEFDSINQRVCRLKEDTADRLSRLGYNDSFTKEGFTGHGIISISIS